jgi:hypothetical protein
MTVPLSAEKVLHDMPVQWVKGGNPTTAIPSGRLANLLRELHITFKPQCKGNRTFLFLNIFIFLDNIKNSCFKGTVIMNLVNHELKTKDCHPNSKSS